MGTWAIGVYGNDQASDWMCDLMESLSTQIRNEIDNFDSSSGESLLAAIDTIATLCASTHVAAPKSAEVQKWHESYVRCWRSYFPELDPVPDYLKGQADVIDDVFSRLSASATAFWGKDPA